MSVPWWYLCGGSRVPVKGKKPSQKDFSSFKKFVCKLRLKLKLDILIVIHVQICAKVSCQVNGGFFLFSFFFSFFFFYLCNDDLSVLTIFDFQLYALKPDFTIRYNV